MSTVRWYSSEDLFATLLILWPYMIEFARKEHWDMPERNEKVWTDLHQLQRLAAAFVMAQKEFESDEFGTGILFISHLLRLERRLGDFRECEPEARHSTIEHIVQLRRDYEWECDTYILMAFLNPSVQFRVGRTCSEEACERVRATLIQLVHGEIDRDIDHTRVMPEARSSDDFRSFIPSEQPDVFGTEEQVSVYTRTRASASHALSYCQGTPAELRHLTTVALKVLGFLATSASVERAFSVARSVTGDYPRAMRQESVSARVMIQANWRIAQPLLADVLARGGRDGVGLTVSLRNGNSWKTSHGALV
jgi:hypothetical protein